MAGMSPMAHFAQLPDPRVERTKRHALMDIVAITICATVSGCNSFPEIMAYTRTKEAWLRTFLALPHGLPCEPTFCRLFAALDPEVFEQAFRSWVRAVSATLKGWWP